VVKILYLTEPLYDLLDFILVFNYFKDVLSHIIPSDKSLLYRPFDYPHSFVEVHLVYWFNLNLTLETQKFQYL